MVQPSSAVRTRFAPSPTGDLHLGGAFAALASYLLARAHRGRFVVRMEDLDPPRVVAGSAARILEDLRWLGLTWDEGPGPGRASASLQAARSFGPPPVEGSSRPSLDLESFGASRGHGSFGPYVQSARTTLYAAVVRMLARKGLVYGCDCSRAEIARVASAPHAGEEVVYPGTCRARGEARHRRDPALRLVVPEGPRTVIDGALGALTQDLAREVGDFVLRRADGVYAYQLAATVDDLAMRITDVVRGADLAGSTPRQVYLAELLGRRPPRYVHLPLVVGGDGARLAKRTGGARVRGLREAGVAAEEVLGVLAFGLGLAPRATTVSLASLEDQVRGAPVVWPQVPLRVPEAWAPFA